MVYNSLTSASLLIEGTPEEIGAILWVCSDQLRRLYRIKDTDPRASFAAEVLKKVVAAAPKSSRCWEIFVEKFS
jgi:hypothetical protein